MQQRASMRPDMTNVFKDLESYKIVMEERARARSKGILIILQTFTGKYSKTLTIWPQGIWKPQVSGRILGCQRLKKFKEISLKNYDYLTSLKS